jgi:transposase InsO family protein
LQPWCARTAYIERGSPWENGFIESFNARLRDELLDGEIFYTLREAQIVIESWRRHYNTVRPHASIGYRLPHQRCSYRPSPHGRLRNPDQLRRPCSRWRHDQP